MQTVDVIRACLNTNQDHLFAIFASSHSFISREDNLSYPSKLDISNQNLTREVYVVK
jgi:hypothetical protein